MIYLILLLGLVLRLISINQSLWLDEATTALVSKMPLGDIFTKFLPNDFHPPLYYLVLNLWTTVFGFSEISLRLPSVIFGLATIYTIYLVADELSKDKRLSILAASLLATSGLHIYYSQEARMYAMATLLVSLSIYFFIKKKWLTFSIVLMLIGLSDYVSLFILPVFLIVGWKDIKKVMLSFAPLALGFAVWLPIFLKQIGGGLNQEGSNWWKILGTTSFKNIALIPVKFILGRISFDNKFIYTTIVLVVLAIFGFLMFKARKASKLLWLWLVVPVAIGVIISFKLPTLTYFRFLFCLPAMYLLLSIGIEKLGKYKNITLGLILAVNLLTSGYYLLDARFHKENWRDLAEVIGTDKIVLPADSQKEALVYYGKLNQIVTASSLERNGGQIWLSRYVWEIVDPRDTARLRIESLGYNKTAEADFNGVVFWRYENSN